ncbi:hypothetical protein D1647_05195 [Alistipes sp. Z76]|jgi:hypothetical protein|nr:hypothetical protein [Alistipes sp. Z76]NCE67648.1 hypothetical protein [Muribaculaceae bacterium M3]
MGMRDKVYVARELPTRMIAQVADRDDENSFCPRKVAEPVLLIFHEQRSGIESRRVENKHRG